MLTAVRDPDSPDSDSAVAAQSRVAEHGGRAIARGGSDDADHDSLRAVRRVCGVCEFAEK
jgi:hypothetical protein